jgi:hypothetical protein
MNFNDKRFCGSSRTAESVRFQFAMSRFESSRASQAVFKPKLGPLKEEKSPQLAGFCNSAPVSGLPNWRTTRPFRAKSLVTTANIPVFGRLSSETRFDPHCIKPVSTDAASSFCNFYSRRDESIGPAKRLGRRSKAAVPKRGPSASGSIANSNAASALQRKPERFSPLSRSIRPMANWRPSASLLRSRRLNNFLRVNRQEMQRLLAEGLLVIQVDSSAHP